MPCSYCKTKGHNIRKCNNRTGEFVSIFGNKYTYKKGFSKRNNEGPVYMDTINKWVGRVSQRGIGKTIPGKFETREEAEEILAEKKAPVTEEAVETPESNLLAALAKPVE